MADAYVYLGIVMFGLLYMIIKAMSGTEEVFWKALLGIPLNLIVVAMLQIASLLIAADHPGLTDVISIIDALYIGSVVILIPIVILLFCYIMYKIVDSIFNSRKKRDNDWDKWQ